VLGQVAYQHEQLYLKNNGAKQLSEFTKTNLMCIQENNYSDVLRVSDIVLMYHEYIEQIDDVTTSEQDLLVQIYHRILSNIGKKEGLMSSDVKQLSHVISGMLQKIYSIHQNRRFFEEPNMLNEFIKATVNVVSAASNKIRKNINFANNNRFYAIDRLCFQELCQTVDSLISEVNLMA
jgi:DNA replication protein DnaD